MGKRKGKSYNKATLGKLLTRTSMDECTHDVLNFSIDNGIFLKPLLILSYDE